VGVVRQGVFAEGALEIADRLTIVVAVLVERGKTGVVGGLRAIGVLCLGIGEYCFGAGQCFVVLSVLESDPEL